MADLYRRKDGEPGDVHVNQLTKDNATELTLWCGGVQVEEMDAFDASKKYVGINIPTQFGIQRASEGDFIVRGDNGDFWPITPWRFEKIYERVG